MVQNLIDIVERELFMIGQRFDVLRDGAQLRFIQHQPKLGGAVLHRIPASQLVPDRNVARQAKVVRIQDFVGLRIVQDGFGVDAGLVRESSHAGDVVIEGHCDAYFVGYQLGEECAADRADTCV